MTATSDSRFGTAEPGYQPPPVDLPDLTPPPTRRRWPWILALVLTVLIAASLGVRWFYTRHDVTVWRTTDAMPAGAPITGSDLRQVTVDERTIDGDTLTGTRRPSGYARSPLPGSTLLTETSLTSTQPRVPTGRAVVGISLSAAQAPVEEVAPGNQVTVWELPAPDPTSGGAPSGPPDRLARAEVRSATVTGEGNLLATLTVPRKVAARLSMLAAANRVSLTKN